MKTFFRRLTSTVILLSLLCLILFVPAPYSVIAFHFLAASLSFLAVLEFGDILQASGHEFSLKTTSLFVTVTVLAFSILLDRFPYSDDLAFLGVLFLFFIYVIHAWSTFLLSKNEELNMQGIFASSFAYFMFTIPFCCIIWIYFTFPGKCHLMFIFLLLVTKIGDTAAYVFGSLSNFILRNHGGNHKMIPSISPGKSYEGAVAGLLFTMLLSCILGHFMAPFIPWYGWAIVGFIMCFGCMAGDLAESAFKRTCQIKDSGCLLPGIGGVLDLVDSLMVNAPLFVLILHVIFYYMGLKANS